MQVLQSHLVISDIQAMYAVVLLMSDGAIMNVSVQMEHN